MYLLLSNYEEANHMVDKVKDAIENIRPDLQMDGGDIELVSVDGNDVHVRLKGACVGCPMSQMTLKNGVERYVRSIVDPNINIISEN
jgi:Fe-S cluster biogenesis protein NfuA